MDFLSGAEIRRRWGPLGPDGCYVSGTWPAGSITDDTQMTLFTAAGMIRARTRGALRGSCHPPNVVHSAYLRWLATQGLVRTELDGWLVSERVLQARRARRDPPPHRGRPRSVRAGSGVRRHHARTPVRLSGGRVPGARDRRPAGRGIVAGAADDLHLHLVETPPGTEARDLERYPG